MLSLSQFRTHLWPLFGLMKDTGETFDVVYRKKVYEVSVRATNKTPQLTRKKRAISHELVNIEISECRCGNIRLSGVCMDSKCTYTQLSSENPS